MEKEPITIQGIEKLKKELEELKNIKRPKIVEAIAEARAHGDLKENAEYHAAREEQAKTESRIIEINEAVNKKNHNLFMIALFVIDFIILESIIKVPRLKNIKTCLELIQ